MDVLDRMPWMAKEAVFQKIASVADVASLSKQERLVYDENLRRFCDTVAMLEGQWLKGHEEGVKQGMQQGMQQGREEANLSNARKMKAKGLCIKDIADITGLSAADIGLL